MDSLGPRLEEIIKVVVSSQRKMITNKNTEIQEDSEQILANM